LKRWATSARRRKRRRASNVSTAAPAIRTRCACAPPPSPALQAAVAVLVAVDALAVLGVILARQGGPDLQRGRDDRAVVTKHGGPSSLEAAWTPPTRNRIDAVSRARAPQAAPSGVYRLDQFMAEYVFPRRPRGRWIGEYAMRTATATLFAAGLAALPLSTAKAQYCASPLSWPFCIAGAAINTAATIATAPFHAISRSSYYYGGGPYYYNGRRYYYRYAYSNHHHQKTHYYRTANNQKPLYYRAPDARENTFADPRPSLTPEQTEPRLSQRPGQSADGMAIEPRLSQRPEQSADGMAIEPPPAEQTH